VRDKGTTAPHARGDGEVRETEMESVRVCWLGGERGGERELRFYI
jgi:hypothetical protein